MSATGKEGRKSISDAARKQHGPAISAALLERILQSADDAIISVNSAQEIVLFNSGAERIFGYSQDDILGRPLADLVPANHHTAHAAHVEAFANASDTARRMSERSPIAGVRRNGEEFPCEASISRIDMGDGPVMTVILRDVTERRRAEERLEAALQEKDVLLREVHHRVKNNLQVISSLLSLQSRAVDNADLRKPFEETQRRVQSMGLIHEQLYATNSTANLKFSEYTRGLVTHLFRAYHVGFDQVEFEFDSDDVSIGMDVAVPCGLILNELISNALKYAFPDDRRGTIRVAIDRYPDESVGLAVADDGIGLPSGLGFWTTKTLGLRLVRSLVRQLDGEVELSGPPGVTVRIRFSPVSGGREIDQ